MNKPVRVGLMGVGGHAQRHLTTMRTLAAAGHCRLVAAADPFAGRLPEVVSTLRAEGVELYDEASILCERDDVDAILIATPIPLHVPQTLLALEAGKHVYLEKPPCVTLAEHQKLMAARRPGQNCVVGFQMQTSPATHFLKKQLLDRSDGTPRVVWASVRWRREDSYYARSSWAGKWRCNDQPTFDGPATNALAHVVHGALHLAGPTQHAWGKIKRVRGRLKKARPMESYDAAYLEAETDEGVLVRLALVHCSAEHDEVVVRCRPAMPAAAPSSTPSTLEWSGRVTIPRGDGEKETLVFTCEPHVTAILDFLAAINDSQHRPATDLADTLPYLQTVNGALQSSGGAQEFAAELVSRSEDDTPACYTVAGLDEQMLRFAADPETIPELLAPGDWIEADALRHELVVP